MYAACQEGHLSVCQWLAEVGASADITRVTMMATPDVRCLLLWSSVGMSVVVRVGASVDITRASNNGTTPMYIACQEGHMSVCQWLFEVGASADITRANNHGFTRWLACQEGHMSVCQWLFEVGASADITRANNNGWTDADCLP